MCWKEGTNMQCSKYNTHSIIEFRLNFMSFYYFHESQDAIVIGISPDSPNALVKFRQKHDLPFLLLSDPDHEVAEAYGAWGEKRMYGKTYQGIIRSHYGIDEDGRIAELKIKVKPLATADLALRLIDM